MSRVTIGKLAGDFNSATFQERQKTKDIEVVPRKVVEDIISCLQMDAETFDELGTDYGYGCRDQAKETIKFAEKCLEKFDAEYESEVAQTCRHCKYSKLNRPDLQLYSCRFQTYLVAGEHTCESFKKGEEV